MLNLYKKNLGQKQINMLSQSVCTEFIKNLTKLIVTNRHVFILYSEIK